MKLRIRNNTVRLRLTRSEAEQLAGRGFVEEAVEFGPEPHQRLVYRLESSPDAVCAGADFEGGRITVRVPRTEVSEWVGSDLVGIYASQESGAGAALRLLIEKDFACSAPRAGEDDADAFPSPGRKCGA